MGWLSGLVGKNKKLTWRIVGMSKTKYVFTNYQQILLVNKTLGVDKEDGRLLVLHAIIITVFIWDL